MTFRPSIYKVCVRILRRRYWKWEIPPSLDELVAILRSTKKKLWRTEGIKKPNHLEAYHAARVFLELKRERSGPVPRDDAERPRAEGMMRRDRSAGGVSRRARPGLTGCNAGDDGRSPLGGVMSATDEMWVPGYEGWITAEAAATHGGAAGTRFKGGGPSQGRAVRRLSRERRAPNDEGRGRKEPRKGYDGGQRANTVPTRRRPPFPRGSCLGRRSGLGYEV